MTPDEIKKLYRADKSSWIKKHCIIPLTTISINSDGDISLCFCEAWLPKILGNILSINSKTEFNDLFLNNPIRDSIIDLSHRFCRGNICTNMQEYFINGNSKKFVATESLSKFKLKTLHLQLDESCNLGCVTCRNNVIVHQPSEKLKMIFNKIDDFLDVEEIFLQGNGEFLASKQTREWLLKKAKFSKSKFMLQTNGTLIYQYRYLLDKVLSKTSLINISIDASNPSLYKTVRNGNWDNLIMGIEYLTNRRKTEDFELRFNFTVSSLNYFDMFDFVTFCQQYNPTDIYFSKMERWRHLTDEQWSQLNVFNSAHESYTKLIEISNQIKNIKGVTINFASFV